MNCRRPIKKRARELLALCMLAFAPALHAQQNASALPEPLRNMPRAGESCRKEPAVVTAHSEARVRGAAADLACIANAVDAREAPKTQAMLIDVRQQAQFQRFHIPGSANLQAANLVHMPSLKTKEILLVGDGKSERELYSICGQLKQEGFSSVRVLAGGVASYLAAGLSVNGKAHGAHELAAIDAAQLWAEGQFAENLLVVADKSPGYSDYLPYTVGIAMATPAALAAVLDRHRKDAKRPVAAVVLIGAPVVSESTYRQLAASVAPTPLLIYPGSASALKSFVATQKAVWAAQARGPKQPRCG